MLPRTKYNRFRNDSVTSVDDLLHSLSLSGGGGGGKVPAARAAPAAAPYLVSADAPRGAPDDGPGSLGHLLHKVSHLKLSSSGRRGLSAARERAGARLSGSCSAPSLAAPDGGAAPGPRAPAMRAARKGWPGDAPPPRAPPASDRALGAGVTYVVKVGAGAGGRRGARWGAAEAEGRALLGSQLAGPRGRDTPNAPPARPSGEGLKTVTPCLPGSPWPLGHASAECPARVPVPANCASGLPGTQRTHREDLGSPCEETWRWRPTSAASVPGGRQAAGRASSPAAQIPSPWPRRPQTLPAFM